MTCYYIFKVDARKGYYLIINNLYVLRLLNIVHEWTVCPGMDKVKFLKWTGRIFYFLWSFLSLEAVVLMGVEQ
ncbi:hypothetical protein AHMF7605_24005 [Adhaeribacter arboris]|uniref:Uncharacterized protein n=1 Tax=Adhaeribacter arboris TaxID=2072846 RepID=A0A2T2YLF9_9BACT|nr:hypothetical protein AHMF7605_24005 [Adhaeribacter arboris]